MLGGNKMDFADDRSRSTSTASNDGLGEEARAKEFEKNKSSGNVLFVGNLPFQTPWQNIKDQFRRAGKVRYTDLVADRMGRPKGSALVTMSTSDGCRRAINLFNETDFEGRRLIVRLFDDGPRPALVARENMPAYNRRTQGARQSLAASAGQGNNNQQQQQQQQPQQQQQQGNNRPQQQQQQQQQQGNNRPQQQQQQQQQQQFQQLRQQNQGNQGNQGNNRPQQQQQQQQRPKSGGNNQPQQQQQQQQGEVPKPRSQQVPESDRKLFISNLPFDCTSAALRETFQQIGTVERSEIIVGRNGKSRGMGIVVLGTQEEARVAIAEFDGIEMAGRAMNVRLDNKA